MNIPAFWNIWSLSPLLHCPYSERAVPRGNKWAWLDASKTFRDAQIWVSCKFISHKKFFIWCFFIHLKLYKPLLAHGQSKNGLMGHRLRPSSPTVVQRLTCGACCGLQLSVREWADRCGSCCTCSIRNDSKGCW